MKVRIGIAPPPGDFVTLVDQAEAAGVDSLWLSEILYGPAVDPFVGMAYALARTTRLKVGTGVAILPGRHPVHVAKQLVSLAALAPKRVLPAFGLSPARPREREAFPVPGPRGAVFDESMELLRLLLERDRVTFKGEYFSVADASIGPARLDVWLGGSGPAALARVGRFGDGWLASFLTPAEAGTARRTIAGHASRFGRAIEEDHYGMSIAVGEPSAELAAAIARRRPDADPAALVARDWAAARDLIGRYVDEGLTKFVVRQTHPSPGFVDDFVRELKPLEN
ncbi:TIGR03854 family LLM class F420-dependent oxidoreductase [Nonomuraea sp. NPDC050556]|uniref:TIGR03854 family LLM class F420-dependent oxidoreductase n=1 Tax=Nonomuraea sp. NPDC050556 TaxID=3364369 RepID=UPI00378C934E